MRHHTDRYRKLGAESVIYSGGDLPAKVRQRYPKLVALRKPALPGRIVAEILWTRRSGA